MFTRDPDKKAEQQAAKAAADAEKKAAKEAEEFAKSPRGQARAAFEAGDAFFQYSGPLSETKRSISNIISGSTGTQGKDKTMTWKHTDTLGIIEDEGWTLADVGYVYEPTGSVSRDKFASSGQTATMTGRIVGVYLFRRTEDSTKS